MIRSTFFSMAALCLAATISFAAESKLIPLDDSTDVPTEPRERGGFYKFSTKVNLHKRMLFGWKLELPDGRGLGFGGLAIRSIQERNGTLQRTDDPYSGKIKHCHGQVCICDCARTLSATTGE